MREINSAYGAPEEGGNDSRCALKTGDSPGIQFRCRFVTGGWLPIRRGTLARPGRSRSRTSGRR